MNVSVIALLMVCLLALAPQRSVAGGAAGLVVPDEVLRWLERRGVPFNEAELRRAAAAAMLRAADARAELRDEEGARWWSTNRCIACATQWPGDLAYVRLNGCFDADASGLGSEIRSVTSTNSQGLIIDLRGAGGFSTPAMAAVGGVVVGEGSDLVRILRAAGATTEVVRAAGAAASPVPPVVLVTDGGTWGAAEGLAWGLKGRAGVLVLGGATSGDGAARERAELGGGYTAVVATGRYQRADGAEVPSGGIVPDVLVSDAGPARAATDGPGEAPNAAEARVLMRRIGGDRALRRAADLLLGLKAMKAGVGGGDADAEPAGGTNGPPAPETGGKE